MSSSGIRKTSKAEREAQEKNIRDNFKIDLNVFPQDLLLKIDQTRKHLYDNITLGRLPKSGGSRPLHLRPPSLTELMIWLGNDAGGMSEDQLREFLHMRLEILTNQRAINGFLADVAGPVAQNPVHRTNNSFRRG